MARTRGKAKLLADLVGARSAPSAHGPSLASLAHHDSCQGPIAASAMPIAASSQAIGTNSQQVLFAKGAATALAFKPQHWSYEPTTKSEGSRLSPGGVSTKEADAEPARSTRSAKKTTNASVSAKDTGAAPPSARPAGKTTNASVSAKRAEAGRASSSAPPAGEFIGTSVSTKETEAEAATSNARPVGETADALVATKEVEAERAPPSARPEGQTTNAAVPIPGAGDARTVEDRTAKGALTAELAEVIDSVLCTHQFATRGMHESLRKRPMVRVLPFEQFTTSQELVSALRAELARAVANPEAEPRVTRSVLDLVLGFIGLAKSTEDVGKSRAIGDQPNVR